MDLINRQAAIDVIIEDKICDNTLKIMTALGDGDKAETLNMTCDRHAKMLMSLPPVQSDLIAKIQNGINITNANDSYSCGMRNGMRWCMSLIDDKEPLFENCPSTQPEPYQEGNE